MGIAQKEDMENIKHLIIVKLLSIISNELTIEKYLGVISTLFNVDYGVLLEWTKKQEIVIRKLCYSVSSDPVVLAEKKFICSREVSYDPVMQAAKVIKIEEKNEKINEKINEKVKEKVKEKQVLSPSEVNLRKPLPPETLIGAVWKKIHVEPKGRKARPAKVFKKERIKLPICVPKVEKKPEVEKEVDAGYKKLVLFDQNIGALYKIKNTSILKEIYSESRSLVVKGEILKMYYEDDTLLEKALKDENLKLLAIRIVHQRMKAKWEKEKKVS